MSALRTRVLATVVIALVGVTGVSAAASGHPASRKHPPAHRHHKAHHKTKIPQHNGGDHDADNNGGPSDGDGNI